MTALIVIVAAVVLAGLCVVAAFRPAEPRLRCLVCGARVRTVADLEIHSHLTCLPLAKGCSATEGSHSCALPGDHPGDHRCGCEMGWSW